MVQRLSLFWGCVVVCVWVVSELVWDIFQIEVFRRMGVLVFDFSILGEAYQFGVFVCGFEFFFCFVSFSFFIFGFGLAGRLFAGVDCFYQGVKLLFQDIRLLQRVFFQGFKVWNFLRCGIFLGIFFFLGVEVIVIVLVDVFCLQGGICFICFLGFCLV